MARPLGRPREPPRPHMQIYWLSSFRVLHGRRRERREHREYWHKVALGQTLDWRPGVKASLRVGRSGFGARLLTGAGIDGFRRPPSSRASMIGRGGARRGAAPWSGVLAPFELLPSRQAVFSVKRRWTSREGIKPSGSGSRGNSQIASLTSLAIENGLILDFLIKSMPPTRLTNTPHCRQACSNYQADSPQAPISPTGRHGHGHRLIMMVSPQRGRP